MSTSASAISDNERNRTMRYQERQVQSNIPKVHTNQTTGLASVWPMKIKSSSNNLVIASNISYKSPETVRTAILKEQSHNILQNIHQLDKAHDGSQWTDVC